MRRFADDGDRFYVRYNLFRLSLFIEVISYQLSITITVIALITFINYLYIYNYMRYIFLIYSYFSMISFHIIKTLIFDRFNEEKRFNTISKKLFFQRRIMH